jgi:hypothetical protein
MDAAEYKHVVLGLVFLKPLAGSTFFAESVPMTRPTLQSSKGAGGYSRS